MKTTILILSAIFLASCNEDVANEHSRNNGSQIKRIIAKESPIENRIGFDLFAADKFREQARTVYYLIAEDGTLVEVGLSEFHRVKIGDEYVSRSWGTK